MTDADRNGRNDGRCSRTGTDDVSRREVLDSTTDGAGRRGFGKLLLAGAAAAAGMSGSASACEDWRESNQAYLEESIPEFYEIAATPDYAQAMIDHQAEHTPIFEVLGERLTLSESEVVNASVRPKPCGGPPIEWEPDLEDLLGEDYDPFCDPRFCDPPGFICPECDLEIVGPEGRVDLTLDLVGDSSGYFYEAGKPIPVPYDEIGWGETPRGHVGSDPELPF